MFGLTGITGSTASLLLTLEAGYRIICMIVFWESEYAASAKC